MTLDRAGHVESALSPAHWAGAKVARDQHRFILVGCVILSMSSRPEGFWGPFKLNRPPRLPENPKIPGTKALVGPPTVDESKKPSQAVGLFPAGLGVGSDGGGGAFGVWRYCMEWTTNHLSGGPGVQYLISKRDRPPGAQVVVVRVGQHFWGYYAAAAEVEMPNLGELD